LAEWLPTASPVIFTCHRFPTRRKRQSGSTKGEPIPFSPLNRVSCGTSNCDREGRKKPRYGVYLKLLTYMYRVGPIVAMPPHVDLFVPQALKRNGAATLGTAWV
jgi:hypothetical protein